MEATTELSTALIRAEKVEVTELTSYIKKMMSFDRYINLVLDGGKISSRAHNSNKSAMKIQAVEAEDLFEFADELSHDKPVNIVFFNGMALIKALKHFGRTDVQCAIKIEDLGAMYNAESIVLYNEDLKLRLNCGDPNVGYTPIPDEVIENVILDPNPIFEIDLEPYQLDQIKNLFEFDGEDDKFTIIGNEKKVSFGGTGWNYDVYKAKEGETTFKGKYRMYKEYLDFLDGETYSVSIFEDRLVFKSLETETHVAFTYCGEV